MLDKLIKHPLGYFEVLEKPSQEELDQYYSQKYYQQSKGAYQANYTPEEITFFNNKIDQKYSILLELFRRSNYLPDQPSLLDVGCGEGWALQFFKEKSWSVTGIDYSSYGCETFNPDCLDNLIVGNIYEQMNALKKRAEKYDVIWLTHVLEHVLNPISLLQELKELLSDKGILLIQVPNDFSNLQIHLLKNEWIDHPFWVAIPDHISYFNKESFMNLAEHTGWIVQTLSTSYPIDLNLFNERTNYITESAVGKTVHQSRVRIENFFHDELPDKGQTLYQEMAKVGLGRDLIAFMNKKNPFTS